MIVLPDESVKHQSRFDPCRIKFIILKHNNTVAIYVE